MIYNVHVPVAKLIDADDEDAAIKASCDQRSAVGFQVYSEGLHAFGFGR